jgi:EAL domain-containing protein (putative c-di-GMP-specific phosphodiesterase class I)
VTRTTARPHEAARQAAVRRFGLAGVAAGAAQDGFLRQLMIVARRITRAEYAAIQILDGDREVTIAGSPGVALEATDRWTGLGQRVLDLGRDDEVCLVGDAIGVARFADSPRVNGDVDSIRYFVAVVLPDEDGLPLGILCAWSGEPSGCSAAQLTQFLSLREAVLRALGERRRLEQAREPAAQPAPGAGHLPGPSDRVTDHRVGAHSSSAQPTPAETDWTIDRVLAEQAIRAVFQPIVHLGTSAVVGFEALTRGPLGTELEAPTALLAAASEAGKLGELDWLCRVHAMEVAAASDLPPSLSWFINVEPAGLAIDCPPPLLPALARARAGLRVILEVVERDSNGYVTQLLRSTDQAREDAWGVALDNVGAEVASLALLPFLQPDVVKLDLRRLHGASGYTAASVTSAVHAYAERTGAVILAEGIETEEDERLARVFGATYAQGYRYGRPGALPTSLPTCRQPVPLRQPPAPIDGTSPFEIIANSLEPQRARRSALQHIPDYLEDHALRHSGDFVVMAAFPPRVAFTEDKQRVYAEIAGSNQFTAVLGDGVTSRHQPRYHAGQAAPGGRIGREWIVITLSPHYAAAFVAREAGPGNSAKPDVAEFDFIYTHERALTAEAGRAFLQDLLPRTANTWLGGPIEEPSDTVDDLPRRRQGKLFGRGRTR